MNNEIHTLERAADFLNISAALDETVKLHTANAMVAEGDSLTLLKRIPDQSISLILTDPPYHSTKKANITNDTAFDNDDDFLSWIAQYAKEWKRILRPNGSMFFYCSSTMSAKLEVLLSESFNVLSHVVWTKPNEPGFEGWKQKMNKAALRQWYGHSERILFAEPAVNGNLKRSWFGHFLRSQREHCGMSGHRLTEITGAYGKVNHGGAVSNWEAGRNIPSREQYSKICQALLETGKVETMPIYENVVRPFDVNSSVEFTDVWDFFSVRPYKGKHPAEKPLDMLEHCILSATYENDIVLDCFAGSGSTAVAALNTKRKAVSIELEPHWTQFAANRIIQHERALVTNEATHSIRNTVVKGKATKQAKPKQTALVF